ncbi:DNA polymerase III subunit delta [Candidatus Saccharibacteria bacterium]|nr:DNA polymerase III subunit delta [Candidatus Saccharibacteria bacterium]
MIVVLTGTNDYLRTKALADLRSDFVDKYGDFDTEKLESENITFDKLLGSVVSIPFMSERKLVVLRGISSLGLSTEQVDKLIEASGQTTDLIIDEPEFDKRSSVYKKLKKQADFREFTKLESYALGKWLIAEVAIRGGSIDLADAQHLLGMIGDNQLMLSNEIDKLLSFDTKISRQSIDRLVEPVASSKIFDLLHAMFDGNKQRALELYNDQRRQNVEPHEIIGMIAWQLHVILLVKYSQLNKISNIASFTKLNPYVVTKTSDLTSNLSEQKIQYLVSRLLNLDYDMKTRSIDVDDAVQNFILAI